MIENILKHYYDFKSIELKEKNDNNFIINFNNELYYFYSVINSAALKELYELNIEINKYENNFNKIILNKFGNLITVFENKNYILVKISESSVFRLDSLYIDFSKYKKLYRNNWAILWSQKIDYLEFQRDHIKGEYPKLDSYFDFFCGLTENAIYLVDRVVEQGINIPVSIQHKRYNSFFYDNPLNLIIDYRVRDLAELIKYKYFYESISIDDINKYIVNKQYSEVELNLLYIRLLYPSIYFDVYDEYVNSSNKMLSDNYSNVFDNYLKYLNFISQIKGLKKISSRIPWIKKVDLVNSNN